MKARTNWKEMVGVLKAGVPVEEVKAAYGVRQCDVNWWSKKYKDAPALSRVAAATIVERKKKAQAGQTEVIVVDSGKKTEVKKSGNTFKSLTKSQRKVFDFLGKVGNETAVLVKGEAGLGKTELVRQFAESKGKRILSWNMNGTVDVADLLGHYISQNGSTSWVYGVVSHAVKNGLWLCLDEINAPEANVLFSIHGLLDDRKTVILSDHNEVIEAHPDFRFFATCNEGYLGTREFNKAFLSRFNAVVKLDYPEMEEEVKIISDIQPDESKTKIIAQMLAEMRKANLAMPLGIRESKSWAYLSLKMELKEAFEFAIENKAGDIDLSEYKGLYFKK